MTEPEHTPEDAGKPDGGTQTRSGHGHGHAGGKPGAPGDKADKRKTTIIVILTAVGVAIAYLSFRSSGGSSDASGTGTSGSSANDPSLYPSDGSDGTVDGSGTDGLAAQLSLLEGQVSALAGTVPATGVTKSVASPHFHYQSGLHYLYDRATGTRYQVEANGARVKISQAKWQEILGLDPNAKKDERGYGTAPKTKAEQTKGKQHKKATTTGSGHTREKPITKK